MKEKKNLGPFFAYDEKKALFVAIIIQRKKKNTRKITLYAPFSFGMNRYPLLLTLVQDPDVWYAQANNVRFSYKDALIVDKHSNDSHRYK